MLLHLIGIGDHRILPWALDGDQEEKFSRRDQFVQKDRKKHLARYQCRATPQAKKGIRFVDAHALDRYILAAATLDFRR